MNINITNIPNEILFQIFDQIRNKVEDPSELLKLREVSKQFQRVASDIRLYREFADQFPNLNTLEDRSVTEQTNGFINKYYEIMCKGLGLPNEILNGPDYKKIIYNQIIKDLNEIVDSNTNTNMLTNKLYHYISSDANLDTETVNMFFRSGVKADIQILNHCFREGNLHEKSVNFDLVKLIIKKLETPLTDEQLKNLFCEAVSCRTTKLEVFKFLIHELGCTITNMKFDTNHLSQEIQDYLQTQMYTITILDCSGINSLTEINLEHPHQRIYIVSR